MITDIYVRKLFDYLDYHIPLNTKDNITIIHGPNGCGKTWILQLINAVFHRDFATLRISPFSEIEFVFSDGGHLIAHRYSEETPYQHQLLPVPSPSRPLSNRLTISYYSKRTKKPKEFLLIAPSRFNNERSFPISIIDRELPHLVRIGYREWRDRTRDRILSLDDVLNIYGERLQGFPSSKLIPLWLEQVTDRVGVDFIQSQRLIRLPVPDRRESPSRREITDMVELDSAELADKISNTLKESVKITQSKDRTFPTRLLRGGFSQSISETQLREELSQMDTKRQKLFAAGLLDEEQAPPLPTKAMNEMEQKVLTLYLEDVKDKLRIFDDLQNRISVLMDLVNAKIEPQGKTLFINRDTGFLFKTKYGTGQILRPGDLSSGEQHQLVLLYELLFRPNKRTLFLIDEPEISLNVGWQRRFLHDLSRVVQLGHHSVIIATHSPQIIHNRWDLAVALSGGVKNDSDSNS